MHQASSDPLLGHVRGSILTPFIVNSFALRLKDAIRGSQGGEVHPARALRMLKQRTELGSEKENLLFLAKNTGFLRVYFLAKINLRRKRRCAGVICKTLSSWADSARILVMVKRHFSKILHLQRFFREGFDRLLSNLARVEKLWIEVERAKLLEKLSRDGHKGVYDKMPELKNVLKRLSVQAGDAKE